MRIIVALRTIWQQTGKRDHYKTLELNAREKKHKDGMLWFDEPGTPI
jgi:hypothetical protein